MRPFDEFYKHVQHKDGLGITNEDYEAILRAQNGTCAICERVCKSGRRLAVDHNHATGTVRGLLCAKCNNGLGNFDDDLALLTRAQDYLQQERKHANEDSAARPA